MSGATRAGSSAAPPRILVVGDLVTDVVVRPAGVLAHGSDTAAAVLITGGGGAANTASWLAAAGVPVTLVARVGDDAAGRERCAELAALGVKTAVAVDKSMPTGAIVVLVAPDGERTMLTERGASLALSPADVDAGFAAVTGEPTGLRPAPDRPSGLTRRIYTCPAIRCWTPRLARPGCTRWPGRAPPA